MVITFIAEIKAYTDEEPIIHKLPEARKELERLLKGSRFSISEFELS